MSEKYGSSSKKGMCLFFEHLTSATAKLHAITTAAPSSPLNTDDGEEEVDDFFVPYNVDEVKITAENLFFSNSSLVSRDLLQFNPIFRFRFGKTRHRRISEFR